jgi:hypothetical protein
MATTDASAYPVKGQAYRLSGCILSTVTGNPITGGLTGLSSSVSIDGGGFSAGPTPVEVGTTGWWTLDLTAANMAGNTITVQVNATNANAKYQGVVILPIDLTEPTGHWLSETVKRIEHGWMQGVGYLLNRVSRNKNSGTLTYYKHDNSTAVGIMPQTETDTTIDKGGLQ